MTVTLFLLENDSHFITIIQQKIKGHPASKIFFTLVTYILHDIGLLFYISSSVKTQHVSQTIQTTIFSTKIFMILRLIQDSFNIVQSVNILENGADLPENRLSREILVRSISNEQGTLCVRTLFLFFILEDQG